jgi:opacity protein-like surface antigen
MRLLVLAFALAIPALHARAQEAVSSASSLEGVSIRGSLGVFKPQSGQAKGDGYALGLEWEKRSESGLRYGLDLTLYGADFQTPQGLSCGAFCTVDSTMSLTVAGVGGTVGYGKRLGIADFYVGAGTGLYFSKMSATGNTVGIPTEHDENDIGLGADLRAGVSLAVSERTSLGIQVRRLGLSGSFGQLGSMPIGGTFVLLTLAGCWPHCAR